MRALESERDFGAWLLDIGEKKSGSTIQLPLQCYPSIQDPIHQLYSDIDFSSVTPQELKGRALLTVNNERSMEINNKVLEFMPGNETVYKAVGMIMSEDPKDQLTFPEEFLNSLTPTGLPPYELKVENRTHSVFIIASEASRVCVANLGGLQRNPSGGWRALASRGQSPLVSLNNLPCPSADEETRRILSEEMKMLQNYEALIYFWHENSGWNFESLKDIEALYDIVQTEAKYSLNVPTWAQSYWSYLQYLHDLSFMLKLKTNQQKRLRGGPLVDLVLDKMKKAVSEELEKTKVFLYSTHGLNIAAYLSALGMWNGLEPESCATVLIEMYRRQDNHYVRHLYLNSTTPEREPQQYHPLTVPGCGEFCPLDYILGLTTDMIPQNWEEECQIV
ncbi:Lysosomal acid phosphatase [Araneus ventricosus]|uniref:acid phosphatase n=1 Tax=Araneus ventricosus TaxID=182803 RepID=A0A4Y2EST4_ARAVE|nr:Lysosomal acid phosphatase [Araneus ventricosus]